MEKQFCSSHRSIVHISNILKKFTHLLISTGLRNLWHLFLILTRDGDVEHICAPASSQEIKAEPAICYDFASHKAKAYKNASGPRQKLVHFGSVTEIDQQKWKHLSIGKAGSKEDVEEVISHSSKMQTYSVYSASATMSSLEENRMLNPWNDCRYFSPNMCKDIFKGVTVAFIEFAEAH